MLDNKEAIEVAHKAACESLKALLPAIKHRHELAGVPLKDKTWLYDKVMKAEAALIILVGALDKAKQECG